MILGVICQASGQSVNSMDCLECSLDGKCPYDTLILAEMLYNRPVKGLSLSGVTSDFLRMTLLYQLVDYYITPANGYYSVRGKWIHESKSKVLLSPDFGETIREKRFKFPDSDLSGQIDIYYNRYKRLGDYKSSSRLPDEPRPAHIRQLNAYAELLRANDIEVDDGFLTYLTYSKHIRYPVEVWPREQTQEMLEEMVSFYQDCLDKREVPPRSLCAGPDRWYMCRFCPFNDMCKENPDWWTVPEGTTNVDWEMELDIP